MNKLNLTKTQQNQLIIVVLGAVAAMFVLWMFVVQPAQADLAATIKKTQEKDKQLRMEESVLRMKDEVTANLAAATEQLQERETTFAPGRDQYAWILELVNRFMKETAPKGGLTIKEWGSPMATESSIPAFPYPSVAFGSITAVGYYARFGKFLADFENKFPYYFIRNLEIGPNPGSGYDPEMLSFKFEIVTPVLNAEGGAR